MIRLLLSATLLILLASCRTAEPASSTWWRPENWHVEQRPGGTVTHAPGRITLVDAAGATVWWKEELTAPVRIQFDATSVSAGGPHDRVSDLNCFWMAQEPGTRLPPFVARARSGRFEDYDSIDTYYVGYGGHTNTRTRFRRYDGGNKPLRPEHDLREPRFLLEPNRRYRIEVRAEQGRAEYFRDGELLFSYEDPKPLTRGWFAFRTVDSHLVIENVEFKRTSNIER